MSKKCSTRGCPNRALKNSKKCGNHDPLAKRVQQATNRFQRSKAGRFLIKQMEKQNSFAGMKGIDRHALLELDELQSTKAYISGYVIRDGRPMQIRKFDVCHLAPSKQMIDGVEYLGSNHPKNLMLGDARQNKRDQNNPFMEVDGVTQLHPMMTKRPKKERGKRTIGNLIKLIGLEEVEVYLSNEDVVLGKKYGTISTIPEEMEGAEILPHGNLIQGLRIEWRRIAKYYLPDCIKEDMDECLSMFQERQKAFDEYKQQETDKLQVKVNTGRIGSARFFRLLKELEKPEALEKYSVDGQSYMQYINGVMQMWYILFFVTRDSKAMPSDELCCVREVKELIKDVRKEENKREHLEDEVLTK